MPSTDYQEDNELLHSANAFNSDNERKVRIRKRRFHPTVFGRLCVNAMTGVTYPWRSGTHDEMRLYKVIDATAKYTKEGYVQENYDPINKESNHLYYDSPEEYGRHMRIEIDPELCVKWHARVNRYFSSGKFNKALYEEDKSKGKQNLEFQSVTKENDLMESSDQL